MTPYFDFINEEANLQRPTHLATGSTHTAGYSAPNPPPARQIPIHFVFDPQLPPSQKMRESLRSYLTTKCGMRPVPDRQVARLGLAQETLENPANLTNEATAIFFFVEHVKPLVSDFGFDVDRAGIQLEEAPTQYGAKPGVIWGTRVQVEFKSARALLRHASEIFNIGKANNGEGSALVLRQRESDARSIIFKVFLPISWFLLLLNDLSDWYKHGHKELDLGNSYLSLVSIFFHRHVAQDTNGEPHHILSCSELVYIDAAGPSLFALCAATHLGARDPHPLVVRPVTRVVK